MPPATAHKKGQYLGQTVILTQGSVCVRQVIKHTFSFFNDIFIIITYYNVNHMWLYCNGCVQ